MAISAEAIVAAITTAISIGKALIEAGKDAAPIAQLIYSTFVGKKKVTQADLDAFVAQTEKLEAELQAPLPEGE